MKNINKIKKYDRYLYRVKCKNCNHKQDYLSLEKTEKYSDFIKVLFHSLSEGMIRLEFCNKCKMETVHELIAIESEKE